MILQNVMNPLIESPNVSPVTVIDTQAKKLEVRYAESLAGKRQ